MNHELDLAWNIISNTDTHLFLTGKAGTGKTTFLRELRRKLPKRMIVVAPTGIAAINAEGVTIHSFFQLPFGPQLPGTQYANNKRYAFRRAELRLIRSVDLIVIDEISMVRADLLDAIDSVLRQYRDRNRPFGGVQMLMIGDMQQLAPVAREEEWSLLRNHYATPYFFSSKVLQEADFVTVELQHVYRQNDPVFLDLLNRVRTNTVDEVTLKALNARYVPCFNPPKDEGYIRLVTHNAQADTINQRELDALTSETVSYQAVVGGDFPEMSYPTDANLTLKVGAQVMFVKNDSSSAKRYFNGMIGEILELNKDNIKVRSLSDNALINVVPEIWRNMKYELDEKTKEINEKEIGTFTQYPLKTAWAITVHKSQGLTFEHAVIDVQHSFAHGQTYVALSRCKSLEGMVLSAPIPQYAIINDRTVEIFQKDPRHKSPDDARLDLMQRHYMVRALDELFSFTHIRYLYNDHVKLIREHFYDTYPLQYNAWKEGAENFKAKVEDVAAKFHCQYQNIVLTEENYHNSELLQERVMKGATYFEMQLCDSFELLKSTKLLSDNKTVAEREENIMQNFYDLVRFKMQMLHYVAENGMHLQEYLKRKAKIALELDGDSNDSRTKESNAKAVRGSDDVPAGFRPREKKAKKARMVADVPAEVLHPELFENLREWRLNLANEKGIPAFQIMSQKVLMAITNILPSNNDDLELISGIGKKFIENYAEDVLAIVEKTIKECGYERKPIELVQAHVMTQEEKETKALQMYLDGKQVEEIATEFMVTESTVYKYLTPALLSGKLPLNHLFEQKRIDAVNKCIADNPEATARDILETLGRDDYDYGIINCCLALAKA